ncbi:hypothetical protein GGR51DRAFT_558554 [Nemania sp. FL0031]|nr:hypothetical protein GGR51DRAFT_558554 [Nemania sp. FL0031]
MTIDPVSCYFVAGICLAGLKLAVTGLKGLFKWIRRWLARKLKLKQYVALLDKERECQQRFLADRLRSNPATYRRALKYAAAVQAKQGENSLCDVEDTGDTSDYETGSDWSGESCAATEVPESDYELDLDTDSD